ncbi:NAD synthetase [Marinobacter sp.]|uniref:NAD synthetase n=1 Tax=Marinobacter sp. TaxID=50741 RepID=UPI0035676748
MEALRLPSRNNPFLQDTLTTRLQYSLNEQAIFNAIDSDPELTGAKVIFIDSHGTSVVLREEQGMMCSFKPLKVVLREPPAQMAALDYVASVKTGHRESNLVLESTGAALSCGAMVLSWVVLITSGAAIPFSAGSSTGFTVLAYGALAASTAQCLNSGYRVYNEVEDPGQNDYLDSQEWYRNATLAVDVISLGGATAAGLMTVRNVKILQSKDVGVTTRQVLEGLNRQERKRLSREIVRSRYPGISNGTIKALERAGKAERRYSNVAIQATTIRQIKDSVSAGMTYLGSALGGGINKLAVAVIADE